MSFKLETDEERVGERMKFAMSTYGVDVVVGNKLGNKKWIRIKYS